MRGPPVCGDQPKRCRSRPMSRMSRATHCMEFIGIADVDQCPFALDVEGRVACVFQ